MNRTRTTCRSRERRPTIQSDGGAPEFRRVLGPVELTALGLGAIVGAGIFILSGTAAAQYAGPAVVFSFVLAGIGCLCVGLCYAELSSMITTAGSAYTYVHHTFGRLAGWIVGWCLLLEYVFGGAIVAVSWAEYLKASMGAAKTTGPGVSALAVGLIAGITLVLLLGARIASGVNAALVAIKVVVMLLFIAMGFAYVNMGNWHPFVPPAGESFGRFGWTGVLRATGAVFFAFIGFDSVTTASPEARNPRRDVPTAVLASIVVCTTLYVLVALVMTGLTRYTDLNAPHPLMAALNAAGTGMHWLAPLLTAATVVGIASVALVLFYGQARILYAMSRDGLLPEALARLTSRTSVPAVATVVGATAAALVAALAPLQILLDLVNVGAIVGFIAVCVVVLVLRARQPHAARAFRAPGGLSVPVAGLVFCAGILAVLPGDTWLRVSLWLVAGLVIYFVYGARRMPLSRER